MAIFENEDYQLISEFIEKRIPVLRENTQFNQKYLRLTEVMEELERDLPKEYHKKFHEMIDLMYETEEYYFALSYSLGVKYGDDLKEL